MRDALGQRGESIFYVLMTAFHSETGPIFKPQVLGAKWETTDYLVELVDHGGADLVPFFFVQVKTTRQGYTRENGRLRAAVPESDMRRLAAYPAPTYVVGIDEKRGAGYIVSANGERTSRLPSIPTAFPIDTQVRERLWEEVRTFWRVHRPPAFTSSFADPEWR